MGNVSATLVAVLASIISLAIIAVLVSKNAQTPTVLTSGGTALASIIQAAVSPVASDATNTFGSTDVTI